jgi:hypothetical protein
MNTQSTKASSNASSLCTCSPTNQRSKRIAKWTTAGGLLGALGLCAACCLLPFALVTAGVATAWAGALEALTAYQWPLLGVTVAFLAYGFVVAYSKPRTGSAAGPSCQAGGSTRGFKIGLWIVTALAVAGIVFEQTEPHLK